MLSALVSKLRLVLLFTVVSSFQSVPRLSFATEPQSDINHRGEQTFVCEPEKDYQGRVTVEWFRNGVPLTSSSPNVLKMHTKGKQHILKVREADKAEYYCKMHLKNSPFKLISHTALLIPVGIDEYPGDSTTRYVQAFESRTSLIPCGPLPHGEPKSKLILRFRQRKIRFENRFKSMSSGDVLILNTTREDAGEYSCIAKNPLTGRTKKAPFMVFLTIRSQKLDGEEKVDASLVHTSPARIEAIVGNNVTTECIGSGYPEPTVKWQRVGSYLPEGYSENDGILTLRSVLARHSGIYECSISNFVSVRTRTELVVLEPPQLKEPDEKVYEVCEMTSLTLECEVIRGKPKPNITWYLNGEVLTTHLEQSTYVSENEVHIVEANKTFHMGHYQCFANNALGQTYVQYFVMVLSIKEKLLEPNSECVARRLKTDRKTRVKGRSTLPVPSKPRIRQDTLNSVTVEWTVQHSSETVFFKVQYFAEDEQWKTEDQDIPPSARSHRVTGLKHGRFRFRVVSVYKNNDHKTGKLSKWFSVTHLKGAVPASS